MRLGLLSSVLLTATLIVANGVVPLSNLPLDCQAPFIYFYGNETDDVGGSTITTDEEFLYLGGRQNERVVISKLSLDGQLIWTSSLSLSSFVSQIIDLKVDREGMLIGCGQTNPSNSLVDISSFAFKMDPENGEVIWSQVYTEANSLFILAYDIIDRADDAPYVLLGNAQHNGGLNTGCDAIFYPLDRNTGELTGNPQHIHLGNCETFNAGIALDGQIYATGRFNNSDIGFDGMRPAVVNLDSTGTTQWSKLYLQDLDSSARLFSSHIVQDGPEHFMVAAHGDANTVSVFSNTAWLFRIDTTGRTVWTKQYTYPERVRAEEVLSLPGGGYLFLASAPGRNRLFLSQLDANGEIHWSQQIDSVSLTYPANELVLVGNQVYLTATMTNTVQQRMALFRFPVETGELPDNCVTTDSLLLDVAEPEVYFEQDVALTHYTASPSPTSRMISGTSTLTMLAESCLPACDLEEICHNGIDDDQDGLTDCDDPDVANDCCCYEAPILELGPDQRLCASATVDLNVDDSFLTVHWSTGDTSHLLTLVQSGTYSVTVTDRCANVQQDTIVLLLQDPTGTQERRQICAGDSVTIFGQFQDEAGQYTETFTSIAGCDSTHTVELVVLESVLTMESQILCAGDSLEIFGVYQTQAGVYQETYTASTGCDSTHSITLHLLAPILNQDTLVASCAGDSLQLFGQTITTSGLYQHQYTSVDGCDSIQLTYVQFPEPLLTRDTILRCADESVDIFGQLRDTPGDYSATFSAQNGCDSTHITTLADETLHTSISIFPNYPGAPPGFIVHIRTWGNGGPYEVSWEGRDYYDNTIQPVPPGEHLAIITTATGCYYELPFTVNDPHDNWWIGLQDIPANPTPPEKNPPVAKELAGTDLISSSVDSEKQPEQATTSFAPTAFSPNQDGINDYFTLYAGAEVREITSLQVYDRWGKELFSAQHLTPGNEQQAWNGSYLNQPLPPGVYIFVSQLEMRDGSYQQLTGTVNLLR